MWQPRRHRPRWCPTCTSRTPGQSPSPSAKASTRKSRGTTRVHEIVKTRGPDGLVYFSANVKGTTTYTNLDTGKTYTNVYRFTERDQRVTNNGDGTLTITIATPGHNKWYDSDGNILFVTAGTFWFQIMVDHGGTPTDPSDDEEIEGSFVLLKEAGRNPTAGRDFCEDLAQFTS